MALQVGDPAPLFSALSDDGTRVDLSQLRGKWVVLFFYPRASSAGCTIEARRFEDLSQAFAHMGAEVVGISTDTEAHQAKFRVTCKLHYPLIPDSDRRICKLYGVMGWLGNLTGQATRQTFLIDPDGRLAHHWRLVNPFSHASEVLEQLQRLAGYTGSRESTS